ADGAGTTPTAVVLQADVHEIRTAHVGGHDVGQGGRHRVHEFPRASLIPADVETAIVANHEMLRIPRIDPDRMLIDMPRRTVAAGCIERRKRLPRFERL